MLFIIKLFKKVYVGHGVKVHYLYIKINFEVWGHDINITVYSHLIPNVFKNI